MINHEIRAQRFRFGHFRPRLRRWQYAAMEHLGDLDGRPCQRRLKPPAPGHLHRPAARRASSMCQAVRKTSGAAAASSKLRLSGMGITAYSGAVMYSRSPPSYARFRTIVSDGTDCPPGNAEPHCRQLRPGKSSTRWPGFMRSHSSPLRHFPGDVAAENVRQRSSLRAFHGESRDRGDSARRLSPAAGLHWPWNRSRDVFVSGLPGRRIRWILTAFMMSVLYDSAEANDIRRLAVRTTPRSGRWPPPVADECPAPRSRRRPEPEYDRPSGPWKIDGK